MVLAIYIFLLKQLAINQIHLACLAMQALKADSSIEDFECSKTALYIATKLFKQRETMVTECIQTKFVQILILWQFA